MKTDKLDNMIKGWFVGGFEPTALSTTACEVAVKHYQSGDSEPAHYHKIATEITVVLSGRVQMCHAIFESGDIITLSPGEITDFKAITDTTTVVVKVPGALDDKYLAKE